LSTAPSDTNPIFRGTSGWDKSKWKDLSPSDKIGNITVQTLLYIENYEPNLNNKIPTERKRKTTKYGDPKDLAFASTLKFTLSSRRGKLPGKNH